MKLSELHLSALAERKKFGPSFYGAVSLLVTRLNALGEHAERLPAGSSLAAAIMALGPSSQDVLEKASLQPESSLRS